MRVSVLLYVFIFFILQSTSSGAGQVREYWIAAEKTQWDYAPSGRNVTMPSQGMGVWGKRTRYEKYRYFQYTDATYRQRVAQPVSMGILGPQLTAVVGDTFKVHFLNRADKPLSMHPHGLRYDEDNDGACHRGAGSMVLPGQTYTYIWRVDEMAGPGPNDPSSVVWLYHSHVDSVQEIQAGLIGSIVITRAGMERSPLDPTPRDIDRAYTTLYMIFDEEHGREEGLKHTINGYIFGNLPGLTAVVGERVRWYLLAMGSESDLHTAHWHGQTVLLAGRRTDVVELLPASMKTIDMVVTNPGRWLYHCHVLDHLTAGMTAQWTVYNRDGSLPASSAATMSTDPVQSIP